MKSNIRIASLLMAVTLLFCTTTSAFAATDTGTASIGFSSDSIYYLPYGISGVNGTLDLDFGNRNINTSTPVQVYSSLNEGGYVVNNQSGGTNGYRVTLGLSSFDNGLEGASLTIRPDNRGLVSGDPYANDPPVLMNNQGYVTLEADSLSSAVVLRATSYAQNPAQAALGRWGFNFYGELQVYTSTIVAGRSRAIMTWELAIV